MDLYYRETGDGTPVLMLHGLFGSADNLGALTRAMGVGYRIISADLRNHGRSPHTATMSYPEMAEDVFRLMDRLDLEQVHIFGHSMGGKVAMQMALTDSARIGRLVVGDIAPVTYGHHHDGILEGMRAVANSTAVSRGDAEEILAPYVVEPDVLSFLLTNWRRDQDGVGRWRVGFDTIERDYDNIVAGVEGKPANIPVLFLRGGDSDYILPEYRDIILKLFPKATVRTIEGTGHWLHAGKPELVARLITRFLTD